MSLVQKTLFYFRTMRIEDQRSVSNFLASPEAFRLFLKDWAITDNLALFLSHRAFRNFNMAFSSISKENKIRFMHEFGCHPAMWDFVESGCARTECWMIFPVLYGYKMPVFELCLV